MEVLAITLTLVAVLGMTSEGLLRKFLLSRPPNGFGQKSGFTEKELLVAKCAIAALTCFVFLLLFGGTWNTLAPGKDDFEMWCAALALTTVANVLIQFGNMRATRLGDLSFVAPISAMTPGLVLATAFLIGEEPATIGYIGIALVVAGTYVFVREGAPLREYFVPLFFWRVFLNSAHLPETEQKKRRALRWAYGSALCATFGLMGDGLVARHGDMILAVALELTILALVYLLFLARFGKEEQHFAPFSERMRRHGGLLVGFGVSFSVPFIMLGVAFRLAPISEVGSLKRLAIVLTVVGARFILGERAGPRRMLLALIIVAGSILISLDPTQGVVLDSADEYLQQLFGR